MLPHPIFLLNEPHDSTSARILAVSRPSRGVQSASLSSKSRILRSKSATSSSISASSSSKSRGPEGRAASSSSRSWGPEGRAASTSARALTGLVEYMSGIFIFFWMLTV